MGWSGVVGWVETVIVKKAKKLEDLAVCNIFPDIENSKSFF